MNNISNLILRLVSMIVMIIILYFYIEEKVNIYVLIISAILYFVVTTWLFKIQKKE